MREIDKRSQPEAIARLIRPIMDEQITAMTPMSAAKRRNALCLMRREILFARANFTMRDFKLLQTRVFVNDKISS